MICPKFLVAQEPRQITAKELTGVPDSISNKLLQKISAQTDSAFRFQKKVDYPVAVFSVNNLGELYMIDLNNQLKKLNDKFDSVGVFNQVTKFGKLTSVDAQNPWRTILFYENFSNIVLLDKYLDVVANINLRKQNIFGVKAITASYDNNIWVFDSRENKLKKIDDAGNVLMETADFRQLFDSVPSPSQIIDRDGFVYLYDPQKGFYIFDYYGGYKNRLRFLNWKEADIINKNIYGWNDDYFYKYSVGGLNLQQIPLPADFKNYSSLKMANSRLYVLRNNELKIYTFQ
jgi:hypothetical protein